MTRISRFMLGVVALAVMVACAAGDLIPTPDFSDHPIPTTVLPQVDSPWWLWIDSVALLVALGLATYFALVTRSRSKLFMLSIGSVAWFGFVRGGCVCSVGATQNVALALADSSYAIPMTVVIFFALPLVFTLFFGRTFCAAVCPLGAVQELVTVRSVRVPTWLDQSLGLLAYIYLGAAIVLAATNTAFIVCRFDPFVPFFRLSGSTPMLTFGASILLLGVFVGRPYCRYLCPYGAILRVLSRFSKWHVRIPPAACINCRLCEDVCPYDAIRTPSSHPTTGGRSRGQKRLLTMLGVAPLIVVGSGWAGSRLGEPLGRWNADVQLAEELRREELGLSQEASDATEAFRVAGGVATDAFRVAIERRERFGTLGIWLGAWAGLVVAVKLIQLSLPRRGTEHEPDRSGCVACGRCFWYCPVEQVRLGLIKDVGEIVTEEPK